MTLLPVTPSRRDESSRRRSSASWSVRASLSEGLSNTRFGGALASSLIAIVTVIVAAMVAADILEAARILSDESRYLNAGGDILVVQRNNSGTINVRDCVAMERLTGVRAAAATSVIPDGAALVGRPDSQQTVVTATDGILRLFALPFPPARSVIVSRTIADRWNWSVGSRLAFEPTSATVHRLPTDTLRVAEIADLAKLGDADSTAIMLLRSPVGDADSCYIRVWPQYRSDVTKAVPALFGDTESARIQVSDLLSQGAFAQNPARMFNQRSTRPVGLLAGVVMASLWGIVAWMRRGRAALYASLGVPYSGGVLIRLTEGAIAVVLGTLWGTAMAIVFALADTEVSVRVAFDLGLRQGAVAMTVGLVGVVLAGLWLPPVMASLKERQ